MPEPRPQASLHSASITWTPPEVLGSPVLHYLVSWSGPGGGGERLLLVAGETTEVTDLAMGEEYDFVVKVREGK